MDIIEANECLRHWYGPPVKGSFDNTEVGVTVLGRVICHIAAIFCHPYDWLAYY
jgi:hypothetical protein